MYASLHDAVRFSMKVELQKSYSKADLSKQKWNSLVSCSQHSYSGICPFGGWGGGGGVREGAGCETFHF